MVESEQVLPEFGRTLEAQQRASGQNWSREIDYADCVGNEIVAWLPDTGFQQQFLAKINRVGDTKRSREAGLFAACGTRRSACDIVPE